MISAKQNACFTPSPLRLALTLAGVLLLPAVALANDGASSAQETAGQAQNLALIEGLVQQDGVKPSLQIRAPQRPDYDITVLDNGRRVQIDFINTRFGPGVQALTGKGPVLEARPSQVAGSNTARLEIKLDRPMPIMVEPAAGGYRIAFSEALKPAPALLASAAPASATPEVLRPEVQDIAFRRGPKEGGRLELQLAYGAPSPDLHRDGNRLILDLAGTRLPGRLERRLDVTDFGTPVRTIDSYRRGRDTRLVFDMPKNFEYAAYQVGNRVVVDVKPKAEIRATGPATPAEPGKPYNGSRFSMDFQAIDVRNALQVIADFTGINIIMADNVSGNLTMRLKNVPWDQALDIILESKGLGMKRQGNIIWVAPQKELAAQEEARLKAEQAKVQLEPTVTELIQINYARAEDIAALLNATNTPSTTTTRSNTSLDGTSRETEVTRTGLLGSLALGTRIGNNLLSDRGAVTVDKRTNSILVKETPGNLASIKRLVARLDRPVKQVLIESRIVVASTTAAQSLGVRWGGSFNETTGYDFPSTIDLSGDYAGGQVGSGQGVKTPSSVVNFPAIGAAGFNPASLGVRLGNMAGTRILDLQLSAIQSEGLGRVVSSPRVITGDQQKALIEQGKEIPYQAATSSGATSVTFKKAVLSLEVTPHITPDGKVQMEVLATKDSKGEIVPGGVAIDTRKVNTNVLVNNGETIVIGGIYEEEENESEAGVPGLRKIPVLGYLFKGKAKTKNQTELLIFLTPKIVEGVERPAQLSER